MLADLVGVKETLIFILRFFFWKAYLEKIIRWEEERLQLEGLTIQQAGKWLSQKEEMDCWRKQKNYPFFVMLKLDWLSFPALESFMIIQALGTIPILILIIILNLSFSFCFN